MRGVRIHYSGVNKQFYKTRRAGICDWIITKENGFGLTRSVSKVTCKRCLRILAGRAGLISNTPAEIIHDALLEQAT